MCRVTICTLQDHHFWLIGLAGLVCVTGCGLSVLLTQRLCTAGPGNRAGLLALTGLMAGTTVWATHFIALMSLAPGLRHGYDPAATVVSLVIACFGTTTATALGRSGPRRYRALTAGAAFGLCVAALHYASLSAYRLPGRILWDPALLTLAVVIGMGLSLLAQRRITDPALHRGWPGTAAVLSLAICMPHVIGMAATTIAPAPMAAPLPPQLSDAGLAQVIMAAAAVLLLVGFACLGQELRTPIRIGSDAPPGPLTALPDWPDCAKSLKEAAAALAANPAENVAVLSVNLRALKGIDGLLGAAYGDIARRVMTSRLRDILLPDEVIVRVGHGTCVALKSRITGRQEVGAFARRLRQAIRHPFPVHGQTLTLDAAIGIASSLDDGRDMEGLILKSELALARAAPDTGDICHYDPARDARSNDEVELAHDLRSALAEGALELLYQRQNDAGTGQITGFEVLLRWHHPTRGMVMPAVFIPIAEQVGLIHDIGRWVLREACGEAAQWRQCLPIAVNVTQAQLADPLFADSVAAILQDSGLDPDRLELDVSEDSLVAAPDRLLPLLQRLRDLGVRIAIDDFGRGVGSLAILQAFPFDRIKIDRSLIREVNVTHRKAAILQSTLISGRAFDSPVLAEGVETQAELAFVAAAGCRSAQGFYFGPPMVRTDLHAALLAEQTEELMPQMVS